MALDILDSKTVTLGGIPIAYRDTGHGQPLVFVSGWSLEYSYWDLQVDEFGKDHRVLAYDRRAQGCSGGTGQPFDFDDLVAELDSFLRAVTGDDATLPVLVGHSLAGSLVLQYAVEHPGSLRALVVADTPPVTIGGRIAEGLELAGFRLTTSTLGLAATMGINRDLFWSRSFRESNAALMAVWAAQYQTNPVSNLVDSLAAWVHRADVDRRLNRIQVPTLLLVGSEDAIVSVADMEKIAARITGSQLGVVEGAGHMSFVEQPGSFNGYLRDFLARL